MDGEREVRLIVGTDPLHDLAFRNGNDKSGPIALWELYRDELESVASEAYANKPDSDLLLRLPQITDHRRA